VIPGETILGLDFGNHLWVVLTPANSFGDIVIVNLTTHGRGLCGPACTTIAVGEQAFVTRESCVYYRGVMFNPVAPLLQAREQGFLRQHDRVSAGLLLRIQDGALADRVVPRIMKIEIEASVVRGSDSPSN